MAEDIFGIVQEKGVPVTRKVKLFNANTYQFVQSQDSNYDSPSGGPTSGKYFFSQVPTGKYFILVFDEEGDGISYNAKVAGVVNIS